MRITDFQLVIDPHQDGTSVTLVDVATGLPYAKEIGEKLNPLRLPAIEKPAFGKRLAKCILPPKVAEALSFLVSRHRIRLWLAIAPGPYRAVPWEFAHFEGGALACHMLISLVRGLPGPLLRFGREDALSVLLVSSNPGSPEYPPLIHLEGEMESLEGMFTEHETSRFRLKTLRHARRETLLSDISTLRPDILHFIGHGSTSGSHGALVMEAGLQRHELLHGEELAEALGKAGTRMASFSSCFSAGSMASVGHLIGESGQTTVLGMQGFIRDTTTLLFAGAFYSSMIAGRGVDEAAYLGRSAIHGCGHEAGLPVLIAGSSPASPPEDEAVAERLNYVLDHRPFVGRHKERQQLREKLRRDDVRMVTVTGMGGMGKTRIAKQVGSDLELSFTHGVRLVECDVAEGRDELLGAIAKAVEAESVETAADLGKALQKRSMLLVLDCFENQTVHSDILHEILRQAPNVKMLVTSRRVLQSDWEHHYELRELGHALPVATRLADSVTLFLWAAEQAKPGCVEPEDMSKVEELMTLLQGVPLAILLAAGRLRYRSLRELHERLKERLLDELRGAGRQLSRHASIRVVIRDSFDHLSDREKRLAIQLAVFTGGFAVDDAGRVVEGDPNVEEGIEWLYDQSLLASLDDGPVRRYRELDTVREYMAEQRIFDKDALFQLAFRHASHFTAKARILKMRIDEGDVSEAVQDLWRDIGNYRAALRFAIASDDSGMIVNLARSLSRAFLEAGIAVDFNIMVREAEKAALTQRDPQLLMELRGLQGTQSRRQGDYKRAEKQWRDRADFAKHVGDHEVEAEAYLDIADMSLKIGELEVAKEMIQRFKDQLANTPRGLVRASGLAIEAQIVAQEGNKHRALALAAVALSEIEEHPPKELPLFLLFTVAKVNRTCGKLSEASTLCRKVIEDSARTNQLHSAAVVMIALTEILEEAGDIDGACLASAIAEKAFARFPGVGPRVKQRLASFDAIPETVRNNPLLKAKPKSWQTLVLDWLDGSSL